MTLVVMVGQQLGLWVPSFTFSQNTWCCTLGWNFLKLRYANCFKKIYNLSFTDLLIHCYSQMKHLIAASIALKGVGSLLFIIGSSFGAYLLVSGYQGFWEIIGSNAIVLDCNNSVCFFPSRFCIRCLLLLYCMTSTTMILNTRNLPNSLSNLLRLVIKTICT